MKPAIDEGKIQPICMYEGEPIKRVACCSLGIVGAAERLRLYGRSGMSSKGLC